MPSNRDGSQYTQLVAKWNGFNKTNGDYQHIKPVVLEAWERCAALGIDAEQLTYRALSEQELAEKQESNADLIAAAAPFMEYLSMALSGKPHVVALSDQDGWILAMRGSPEAFGGRSTGIWVGYSWAEGDIGNNGIGTALHLEQPTLIYGVEHYALAYHPATCLGVPIRVGDVLRGALDVTVLNEDADPARLTLAQACVAAIENTLSTQLASRSATLPSEDDQLATFEELLANTVHDLKHPLTVIFGISQLGIRAASDAAVQEYFYELQTQVDRLNEMIESLLHRGEPIRTVANPAAIVEDVLDEFSPICHLRGIRVKRIVGENISSAKLKPELFRRAIQNLVSNAVDAMEEGGTLTKRVVDYEDKVRISISDSGNGIPPDIQPHVFEPFISGREDGTGLGLSMVHHTITDIHQGNIWFTTDQENGTTFHVEIPSADG